MFVEVPRTRNVSEKSRLFHKRVRDEERNVSFNFQRHRNKLSGKQTFKKCRVLGYLKQKAYLYLEII